MRWVYAWPEPTVSRFYDERFAIENIRHALASGRLEPANGYHPMLSWLPTAAVLAGVRWVHERIGAGDPLGTDLGRPSEAFYRWGRSFHVALGVLSVFLAWRLGRALGGAITGLLAAAWLGSMVWPVRFSALINEDMPCVVACELALLASLAAVRSGRLRRFAVAGVAIGAATATKLSAAPVALPLVAGAACLRRTWARRLVAVALAAVVAAGTLLVVSPSLVTRPELHARDFGVTIELYRQEGRELARRGDSVTAMAVRDLSGPLYLGVGGGLFALLGMAAGLVAARRRSASWRRRALVVAIFPPLFLAVYAFATRGASPHSWLPIAPVAAVAAGFGGREVLRLAGRHGRAALAGALLLVVAAPVAAAVRSVRFVYLELVPSWADRAALTASQRFPGAEPRWILVDETLTEELSRAWRQRHDRLVLVPVRADGIARQLARSDGAMLVEGPAEPELPEGFRSLPLKGGLWRGRGRPVRLVLGDWRAAGSEQELEPRVGASPTELALALPAVAGTSGPWASLTLELSRRDGVEALAADRPARLRLSSGETVAMVGRRLPGGRALLIGPRVPLADARPEVVVELPEAVRVDRLRAALWIWTRPADRPQSPASSSPSSASASSAAW